MGYGLWRPDARLVWEEVEMWTLWLSEGLVIQQTLDHDLFGACTVRLAPVFGHDADRCKMKVSSPGALGDRR